MGKFLPHKAGSSVSSVNSTTRTVGTFASRLCSAILATSATTRTAMTAKAAASATRKAGREKDFLPVSGMVRFFLSGYLRWPTDAWQRTQSSLSSLLKSVMS